MKTIPFDIEKAKEGYEVVTRAGRPARIICYDVKCGGYPIVALVLESGDEQPIMYTEDGYCYSDRSRCNLDLLLKPKTETLWYCVCKGVSETIMTTHPGEWSGAESFKASLPYVTILAEHTIEVEV